MSHEVKHIKKRDDKFLCFLVIDEACCQLGESPGAL